VEAALVDPLAQVVAPEDQLVGLCTVQLVENAVALEAEPERLADLLAFRQNAAPKQLEKQFEGEGQDLSRRFLLLQKLKTLIHRLP